MVNTSISQSITVVNQGDISAEFAWDLGFMEKFFRILPTEGTIQANQREVFQVTFFPRSLD